MSNDDDPTIVSKEGYIQVKINGQSKWQRRFCIIYWDKALLWAALKNDRHNGDLIELLPKSQIIDSELPGDFIIEIKYYDKTLCLLPESKSEHDSWLIALKRTAYSRFGGALFGQSLECTQKYCLDKSAIIPIIVRQCCEFLLEYGTNFVGLFRIPGKQSSIKEYRDKYDRGDAVEFDSTCSPATVSSLLKIYLQSLPEAVIPMKYFEDFLEIGSRLKYKQTSDLDPLKDMIEKCLPRINYALLAYLCVFLKKLTEFAHETKMDTDNLAITFGSNLIRTADDVDMNMIKGYNCNLVPLIKALIDHSDYLFTKNLTESSEQLTESCDQQHETITKSSGFSSFSSLLSSTEHQTIGHTRSSSLPPILCATPSFNGRVEPDLLTKIRSKSVIEEPVAKSSSFETNSQLSSMTYIQGEKDEDVVERRLTSSEQLDDQTCTKRNKRKSALLWQFSSKSDANATLPRKGSKKTLADKFAKPFSNIKHSMSKAFIPPITSMENVCPSATLDSSFRSPNRRTSELNFSNECNRMLESQIGELKTTIDEKDSLIKNLRKTCDDDRRRYEKETRDLRQLIEQLQYENAQLKAIYQPDN